MKYFVKFLYFFIYSNLFIAICAVLMVNQTFRFLLQTSIHWKFAGFIFFSTLCSYSFHWYLTTDSLLPSYRIQWLKKYRYIHVVLFFTGMAGALFFFQYLLPHWHWLLLSALITFLYSAPKVPHKYFRALRKVANGKTLFLAFVWTYVTTILPVIIDDKPWNTEYILFTISRFSLIYAICLLFDYRDREDDKVAGVVSIITSMKEKNITLLFSFAILMAIVSTAWMIQFSVSTRSVCILLIPVVLTALLYNKARRDFNDFFYYFVLDGLMALSAALMLIPGI